MRCPNCGAQIAPYEYKCPYCGTWKEEPKVEKVVKIVEKPQEPIKQNPTFTPAQSMPPRNVYNEPLKDRLQNKPNVPPKENDGWIAVVTWIVVIICLFFLILFFALTATTCASDSSKAEPIEKAIPTITHEIATDEIQIKLHANDNYKNVTILVEILDENDKVKESRSFSRYGCKKGNVYPIIYEYELSSKSSSSTHAALNVRCTVTKYE